MAMGWLADRTNAACRLLDSSHHLGARDILRKCKLLLSRMELQGKDKWAPGREEGRSDPFPRG